MKGLRQFECLGLKRDRDAVPGPIYFRGLEDRCPRWLACGAGYSQPKVDIQEEEKGV
jgi:hypothetical protein